MKFAGYCHFGHFRPEYGQKSVGYKMKPSEFLQTKSLHDIVKLFCYDFDDTYPGRKMNRDTAQDIRSYVTLAHIFGMDAIDEDHIASLTEGAIVFLEDRGFLKSGESIPGDIVKQALDFINGDEYSPFERYLLLRCAIEMDFGYVTGLLKSDLNYGEFGNDLELLTLRLLSGHEVHEAHEVLKKCL